MDSATDIIAPFVMKTYQMVNDPVTDNLIRWGGANNSFIVVEPLDFSHRLLPVYFKHNNFSSFVRQLNTYGFRKVDPDRWEFANEWFLRGQIMLLSQISRKKHSPRSNYPALNQKFEDDDEDEMLIEIARLKEEQKSLDRELQGMNKRLEATERRPGQMMAFLYKVAEDPEIVPRMMLEKDERSKRFKEKKRRLLISTSSPSPSSSGVGVSSSVKSEEEEESGTVGWGISSPEANFSADTFCQSSPSPDTQSMAWMSRRQVDTNYGSFGTPETGMGVIGGYDIHTSGGGGGDLSFYGGVSMMAGEVRPTPYPFSLLEGGF